MVIVNAFGSGKPAVSPGGGIVVVNVLCMVGISKEDPECVKCMVKKTRKGCKIMVHSKRFNRG